MAKVTMREHPNVSNKSAKLVEEIVLLRSLVKRAQERLSRPVGMIHAPGFDELMKDLGRVK